MRPEEEDSTRPVIRDRRRIDPVTGRVRNPGEAGGQAGQAQPGAARRGPGPPWPGRHSGSQPGGQGPGSQEPGQEPSQEPGQGPAAATSAEVRLAERTADLQRVQAEYANYRKRVERDRMAVREQALANVLTELLPVLDDIGRAREHGELTGGFKSVAESLEAATVKLGLASYGEEGEPFDPNLHEALMHSYSDDVTEPTCVRILQPGYKVGSRILRPARVAVAEPGEPPAADERDGSADESRGAEAAGGAAAAGGTAEAAGGTAEAAGGTAESSGAGHPPPGNGATPPAAGGTAGTAGPGIPGDSDAD